MHLASMGTFMWRSGLPQARPEIVVCCLRMSIIYVFNPLCSTFVPMMSERIGPKAVMVIGSVAFTYVCVLSTL
jgi:MFS-type transporter involved in bile tolerance (Atg22 family)